MNSFRLSKILRWESVKYDREEICVPACQQQTYNIAWYEQKAVIVLLALLYLGVNNIHLGPTLPAFLSPGVANILIEKFGIGGITNVDDDIKMFLA
jgi:hypothetical protein